MTTDPHTRLNEIKARADAATKAPWTPMEYDHNPGDQGVPILGGGERGTMAAHLTAYTMTLSNVNQSEADAEFIAHAREDIPLLVKVIKTLLKVHRPVPARYYGTDLNPDNEFDCWGCGEGKAYPCYTVRSVSKILLHGDT